MLLKRTLGVGTRLQTASRTGFRRTRTRFGRGQRGLGRVAGERGLYAKWRNFIYNYKIYNGLRINLSEFPDFCEKFASLTELNLAPENSRLKESGDCCFWIAAEGQRIPGESALLIWTGLGANRALPSLDSFTACSLPDVAPTGSLWYES
jgi:hypothetical protein